MATVTEQPSFTTTAFDADAILACIAKKLSPQDACALRGCVDFLRRPSPDEWEALLFAARHFREIAAAVTGPRGQELKTKYRRVAKELRTIARR